MDTTTTTLTYRPYKSKRHWRAVSVEQTSTQSTTTDDVVPDRPPNGAPPSLKPRPVSVALPPTAVNGHTTARPSSPPSPPPVASSSKPPVSADPGPTSPKPPTSTFRHIIPPAQPHAPSPLRPRASHSLTVSPSLSRRAPVRRFDSVRAPPRVSDSGPSTRTPSPAQSAPSSSSPRLLGTTVLPPPPPAQSPSPRPSASASPAQTPTASNSQSPSPSSSLSTSNSRRAAVPYRPGFQPKGVYRPRTDDFLAARTALRDRDRVEQHRLERRLEKLIALHFSTDTQPSPGPGKPSHARRASSLFDIDFSKNPADLWRDVVEARMQGSKTDIRAEEQKITPWEDDASASQCALCTTSFHPLTNRKHHCRLCGRIICALPPRPPVRPQKCSLLFIVDQHSGIIEEVGEGVDYGVRRKGDDDRFLRGVRICRDCRVVMLRQQYAQEARHVPTYVRLYMTLTSLEKEIADILPQFKELIVSLSMNSSSANPSHTANLRTRLLGSFGEYDRLAKRIRQLPAPLGGSQDRVQAAIMTRANLFLQKNMFPLQSLPRASVRSEKVDTSNVQEDKDSALAHALQPLLEQEALLETFVVEANSQRKFEDARTLKASLKEIRTEIERLSARAG